MGKAEVGTPKYVANKMKSKGLQRLRWYCQVCEKQCRDENGFKCHTQSESHLRQMLQAAGDRPDQKIKEYSKEFQTDFIQLLKMSHQEKFININKFYQEYIANKDHIHMNATQWSSLSQFAKYLGDQKICNVKETEQDGLCVAWIDNSPRALEMKNALANKKVQEASEDATKDQLLNKQMAAALKARKEVKSEPLFKISKPDGPVKINLLKSNKDKKPVKNVFKIKK